MSASPFNKTLAASAHAAQRGFALATAIFLLVVLAALGVAMVTFSTSQQASSGYDVMGARAYQAARAGLEWALFQRLNPEVAAPNTLNPNAYCAVTPTVFITGPMATLNATSNLTMPAGTSLSPFTVTVTCSAYNTIMNPNTNPATGAPYQVTIRTLTSTACNQPSGGACPNSNPGPDYIQRKVQVTINDVF